MEKKIKKSKKDKYSSWILKFFMSYQHNQKMKKKIIKTIRISIKKTIYLQNKVQTIRQLFLHYLFKIFCQNYRKMT